MKSSIITKYNDRLKRFIEENDLENKMAKQAIPKPLLDFLDEGFEEVDDCYYFKRAASHFSADLFDKTGNECFNNKFYVDMICRQINDPIQELIWGILFCKELAKRLGKLEKPFVVLLCFHDESTEFRFHKKRPEERVYLKDINTYNESIMQIEVLG